MAISAKQYEQMVGRMTGGGKKAADTKAAGAAPQHKVIIGIDPSLRGDGFWADSVGPGAVHHFGSGDDCVQEGLEKLPVFGSHS